MKKTIVWVIVGIMIAASSGTADARLYSWSLRQSFGIRGGGSVNPDQVVVGVQSILSKISPGAYVGGSFDLGFGDDLTTFAINPDLIFHIPLASSSLAFYALAGPTVFVWSNSDADVTESEIGLSIGGGLQGRLGVSNLWTLETRLGLGDIPDVKILFGVLLGGVESQKKK